MSLRQELADVPDIHVYTVLPCSIDTPIFQHAANYTGRAIKPIPPVYSAEEVAKAMIDLVDHPKREVIVGASGKMLKLAQTVAPGLTDVTWRALLNVNISSPRTNGVQRLREIFSNLFLIKWPSAAAGKCLQGDRRNPPS
jgi:hypothetical protein